MCATLAIYQESVLTVLRKKLVKCYIWSTALFGSETWTLRAADQKHLASFGMWCWRRLEISWTDHVRNEEVLLRVNEQRNDSYQRLCCCYCVTVSPTIPNHNRVVYFSHFSILTRSSTYVSAFQVIILPYFRTKYSK